jgi:BAH domain
MYILPFSYCFHPTLSNTLVSNERFELHDTIFVNSQEPPPDDDTKEEDDVPPKTIDETDNTLWVAEVIEVRAQSPWNVWVRIEWFYRPDELPNGRQSYHGRREVIKSPVQDIISAHTVAGHADVTHWEEMDDTQDADGIDGLFWRQTFDPVSGKLGVKPPQPFPSFFLPFTIP